MSQTADHAQATESFIKNERIQRVASLFSPMTLYSDATSTILDPLRKTPRSFVLMGPLETALAVPFPESAALAAECGDRGALLDIAHRDHLRLLRDLLLGLHASGDPFDLSSLKKKAAPIRGRPFFVGGTYAQNGCRPSRAVTMICCADNGVSAEISLDKLRLSSYLPPQTSLLRVKSPPL